MKGCRAIILIDAWVLPLWCNTTSNLLGFSASQYFAYGAAWQRPVYGANADWSHPLPTTCTLASETDQWEMYEDGFYALLVEGWVQMHRNTVQFDMKHPPKHRCTSRPPRDGNKNL